MSHESIRPVPDIKNDIKKPEFGSFNLARAYDFAEDAHKDQFRKSGEPYINHCVAVYRILKEEWGVEDEDCLAVALLHDTVEDTDVTLDLIEQKFGENVANLLYGVTNLKTSNDRENLKKFLNEGYVNPKVVITKLGDRLHNMRTLEFMEPAKQIKKARETLDVFTKLAESSGNWLAKTDLEDCCFKILYPKKYQETEDKLKADKRLNSDFTRDLKEKMEKLLYDNYVYGKVNIKESGRWTLIKKQEKRAQEGKGSLESFKDVDDVVSIRVQLDCIEDCYKMIPKINSKFEGMIDFDRFDQFIGANKRINGYQALHVTVNFPQGPVKIAIMTKEMEEFNKWGVISLINNGKKDLEDYVLKIVFTPTENVRFLPKKATGVDFASAISPRVLAEAESINIDGINYPLSTVIPNASTVEVVLGKTRRAPPKETEDFATMPETKRMIKDLRILEEKDNLIKKGQIKLESILKPRGLLVLTDLENSINTFLNKLGCEGVDDLYFKIGNGSITKDSMNIELNVAGITKKEKKLTSIRLKGPDKERTLVYILGKINESLYVKDQHLEDDGFVVRIIVKDMSQDEEEKLRNFLSNDKRFSEVLVV